MLDLDGRVVTINAIGIRMSIAEYFDDVDTKEHTGRCHAALGSHKFAEKSNGRFKTRSYTMSIFESDAHRMMPDAWRHDVCVVG